MMKMIGAKELMNIILYKGGIAMWWMINAAGERVFTVESEEEAKARLDDWYVDYIYVG